MILVHYNYTNLYLDLYITYTLTSTSTLTLTGYLFDLDQSNVCKDIQKIDGLIRPRILLQKLSAEQKIEQTSGGGSC